MNCRPLFRMYPSQTQGQEAYVEINEEGEISFSWNSEVGNAVPMAVFNRLILRFDVPSDLTVDEMNEVREAMVPLANKITEESNCEGEKRVLSQKGEELVEKLSSLIFDFAQDRDHDDSADCWECGCEYCYSETNGACGDEECEDCYKEGIFDDEKNIFVSNLIDIDIDGDDDEKILDFAANVNVKTFSDFKEKVEAFVAMLSKEKK